MISSARRSPHTRRAPPARASSGPSCRSPPTPASAVTSCAPRCSPRRSRFYVKVEDYRVPEFTVEATTRRSDILAGESTTIDINASYYFGGPVAIKRLAKQTRCDYQRYRPPGLEDIWDVGEPLPISANYRLAAARGRRHAHQSSPRPRHAGRLRAPRRPALPPSLHHLRRGPGRVAAGHRRRGRLRRPPGSLLPRPRRPERLPRGRTARHRAAARRRPRGQARRRRRCQPRGDPALARAQLQARGRQAGVRRLGRAQQQGEDLRHTASPPPDPTLDAPCRRSSRAATSSPRPRRSRAAPASRTRSRAFMSTRRPPAPTTAGARPRSRASRC